MTSMFFSEIVVHFHEVQKFKSNDSDGWPVALRPFCTSNRIHGLSETFEGSFGCFCGCVRGADCILVWGKESIQL